MNPPAYWTWNGQKVVLATGESLLGPGLRAREACPPITGEPGKWRAAERQSDGVVVPLEGTGQQNPARGKRPYFIDASRSQGGVVTSAYQG
jgi:hypothetical protein